MAVVSELKRFSKNKRLPKYKQLVSSISEAITEKTLRRGSVLPSINAVSREWDLARETVVKAYGELKERGIIESTPSKGFYVATEHLNHTTKVFLLLNAFNPYQQIFYNSFKKKLADEAIVDVFFHHYNIDIFKSLVLDNLGKYGAYIIKPFCHHSIPEILKNIESDKLLVIDRHDYVDEKTSYICQDFDKAVHQCLKSAVSLIKKYQKLVLVFPSLSPHPKDIVRGFTRFCEETALNYEVLERLEYDAIKRDEAYISISDEDLTMVLETCRKKGFKIGKDIGFISYNDTPMKRFVESGITVISTDFEQLGFKAACHVLSPKKKMQEFMSTSLIVRGSL